MKPFGPTFKQIRQDKNYSLKQTAEGIVSVQFLSNFENGKSDIKLSNFTMLLNRIHITYEEFLYLYQDESVVDFSKIAYNFHEVTGTINDKFQLLKLSEKYKNLYDQTKSDAFLHVSILCETLASKDKQIDPDKKNIIREYLLGSEYWTKYEFFLFELLPGFFSGEELNKMYNRIIHDARSYPKYYEVIDSEVILNILFDLIREHEFEVAQKYLDNFYENYPEPNLDNLNFCALAEFIKGLLLLARGDSSGRELCMQYLEFINTVPNFSQTSNILMNWIYLCEDYYSKHKSN